MRLFAAADALAELDDEALLDAPSPSCPSTPFTASGRHGEEGYGLEKVRLRARSTAPASHTEFGPVVAAVLVGSTATGRSRDLLERMAAALGTEPDDAREAVLSAVRSLIEQGYVTVTSRSSA
ncbi:MAG: hypothetical protein WKF40_05290 [Thermoleophilaceae bacterium]